MSRSGYTEDYDCEDQWGFIRYRGMVASAIRGKRGQSLFRDILIGMNGMICKRLIADDLETEGAVCAIGAAGKVRGVDMSSLDPEDAETVAGKFDIADCLAREIVWMNDESGMTGEWIENEKRWRPESPEERFIRMRKWVRSQITDPLFDVVWC
ncbi:MULTISPECIES: hypothetical protein [unclassified Bradyrhizobium]|uniref:hypothetical protein n=2 Tax=unclassified Bradyrhizobium TaxID=2631580 RepID=UPI0028E54702|nr:MULTISPECIES: hypothetical protein [unclassified Bradyrhizobium]